MKVNELTEEEKNVILTLREIKKKQAEYDKLATAQEKATKRVDSLQCDLENLEIELADLIETFQDNV